MFLVRTMGEPSPRPYKYPNGNDITAQVGILAIGIFRRRTVELRCRPALERMHTAFLEDRLFGDYFVKS